MHHSPHETICALSTPSGSGGIAVIRISGKECLTICEQVFFPKKRSLKLSNAEANTIHFGELRDGERVIDEVLLSLFRAPHSYTGEDVIEIACHGSVFIQQLILQLLINKGARLAGAGEFTMRSYLNGKMDLSQAEAVADLIASSSEAAHKVAMQQMRGGFSKEISALREQLIHFASMIELELDFAEEDVEFANRQDLTDLVNQIQTTLKRLIDSFSTGNVIKNGVPVAIVGEPNVGKSTLLNALLNEERAIVSDIAGTTRDSIEDEITIRGIPFRFIDTAGIRETADKVETIGISRTYEKAGQSALILLMVDAKNATERGIQQKKDELLQALNEKGSTIPADQIITLVNKTDKLFENIDRAKEKLASAYNTIPISAEKRWNLEVLSEKLTSFVNTSSIAANETVVTNLRHYQALSRALEALNHVQEGLDNNITGDFLATDIRKTLHHLGEITGEITTDDLLENIFSKFCIGK